MLEDPRKYKALARHFQNEDMVWGGISAGMSAIHGVLAGATATSCVPIAAYAGVASAACAVGAALLARDAVKLEQACNRMKKLDKFEKKHQVGRFDPNHPVETKSRT